MATSNVAQARLCILLFHPFTHSLFFISTPFIQCLFRRAFRFSCRNGLFQHLFGYLQTIGKIPTTRLLLFIRHPTPQVRNIHHVIASATDLINCFNDHIRQLFTTHGSNSLFSIAFTAIGLEVAVNTNDDEKSRTKELLTRKNLSLALQASAQMGQTEIASILGICGSTVSRIKLKRLEEVIKVLAAFDLNVVPQNYHGDHAEFIDAALVLSYCGIKAVRKDQRLLAEQTH
jgi:predicted XRE-type DNA-binding protein